MGDFARRGGMFELVQLWVNLPAQDKMAPPGYQSITNSRIFAVTLPGGQGTARVIAAEFAGAKGPATTFTPILVGDLRFVTNQRTDLPVADGYTTAVVVLEGALRVNGSEAITTAEVGLLDNGDRGRIFTFDIRQR